MNLSDAPTFAFVAVMVFCAISPRVPTGFIGALGCLIAASGALFTLEDSHPAVVDYYFMMIATAVFVVQFIVNGVMRRYPALYERTKGPRAGGAAR